MFIVDNPNGKGYYFGENLVFNIKQLRYVFNNHISRCCYCGNYGNTNFNCKYCGAKTYEEEVYYDKK